MPRGLRTFMLAVHLTASVGWIGAVVAYLALGIAAVTSQDAQTVRAAWIAMEVTGWFVIVPLAVAALLTGLVMSLGTPWGLFRHYWVLISFVLTIFATVVLVLHMPSVSSLAAMGATSRGCGPARWAWGRPVPRRGRPAGAARDRSTECVQAAGPDTVRVAQTAGGACPAGTARIGG